MDAIEVLRSDHRRTEALLDEFRRADPMDIGARRNAEARLLGLLDVHILLEEELFYPALLERSGGEIVVRDERAGHAEILSLSQRLRDLPADRPEYDAAFRALADESLKHFGGEETHLFPLARRLGRERLRQLGQAMLARREVLASPYV